MTATVRSQAKADEVFATHPEWKGHVHLLLVSNFVSQEPFDVLFKETETPFTFVIHTASPLDFKIQDIEKEMIEPAVKG